jgi:hypothetical protein
VLVSLPPQAAARLAGIGKQLFLGESGCLGRRDQKFGKFLQRKAFLGYW